MAVGCEGVYSALRLSNRGRDRKGNYVEFSYIDSVVYMDSVV